MDAETVSDRSPAMQKDSAQRYLEVTIDCNSCSTVVASRSPGQAVAQTVNIKAASLLKFQSPPYGNQSTTVASA